MQPTRPIIRYYGGKWKIAEWIISFFPQHRVYVEPFGGAGSVLMRKPPARIEIYNDLSNEVVNLFRVLRNPEHAAELRRLLELTPYSRQEWKDAYVVVSDPIEQARRTIILSTMGHNGTKALTRKSNGFRVSSTGYHCMPQQLINYTAGLDAYTERLKNVVIENRDAVEVMKHHDRASTLHYVDPPYLGKLRKDARNMYMEEIFTEEAHEALSVEIKRLQGFVVLSGYPCEQYRNWYEREGWTAYSMQTVTGAAKKGASHSTEVVWLNPQCAAAQKQLNLF